MELKGVDALWNAHAEGRILLGRETGIASKQLIAGSAESYKARRVGAVAEVDPNGSHRCAVSEAESHCLHHVVEILVGALTETEADLVDARIDVTHVVK